MEEIEQEVLDLLQRKTDNTDELTYASAMR